jgi:N-acetylmuramoyl-L-alanine amidase
MREITEIFVHCSATPADMDIGADWIRASHMDPKRPGGSFSDIGYHFVIRRDGKVEKGRDLSKVGAGVAGRNAKSIHICMVGGVRRTGIKKRPLDAENNFTPEQFDALETGLRELRKKFPKARILGHRDADPGKACPSFSVRDFVASRGIGEQPWV